MKLSLARSNRSQRGSVLILAMIVGTIVGVVLASYLSLLQSRMYARSRSFSWNSAIPVLEAGIEEAFTHLRDDGGNLTANGWGTTNSTYTRRRDFSDGSYCLITISNAITFPYISPVIYSQGFVPAPLGKGYISRKVQVTVTNAAIFTKGIQAKGQVDLNGQSTVDSYDSSNTNYSTAGRYDVSKRRDNGGVVTDSNANPAIDVGNGHIYGMADTGATGTTAYNSSGGIGSAAWLAGNSGFEPGYISHDFNASFPDVTAPNASGWLAPDTGVGAPYGLGAGKGFSYAGATYDYLMGNVSNVVNGSFSVKNGMLVIGNATLYITGDFNINASGFIAITNGGTLTVYVGGNTTINGGGVINATGYPTNFVYNGLSTSTSLKYAGGADFIGTVYAPEADFTLTGGAQYFGAAVVNTYTSKSSGAGFHFDESLAYNGNFKLLSYKEL
jgi:hypothetical protein